MRARELREKPYGSDSAKGQWRESASGGLWRKGHTSADARAYLDPPPEMMRSETHARRDELLRQFSSPLTLWDAYAEKGMKALGSLRMAHQETFRDFYGKERPADAIAFLRDPVGIGWRVAEGRSAQEEEAFWVWGSSASPPVLGGIRIFKAFLRRDKFERALSRKYCKRQRIRA